MKNIYATILFVFLTIYFAAAQTYTMGSTTSVNTCSGTIYDNGGSGGTYGNGLNQTMTICPGTTGQVVRLTFTTFNTENTYDVLTIFHNNTTSGTSVAYSGGALPPVITSTNANGCLTLRFITDGTQTYDGFAINISCVPQGTPNPGTPNNNNTTCASADPFCSSSSYNFPNTTSTSAPTGPNYGCLYSQPNPVWYFMQISTPGSIIMNLQQTSGMNGTGSQLDVDFAMWGPFTSTSQACTQINSGTVPPLQCSYSASYQETIALGAQGGTGTGQTTPANAAVGQIYMVLLTNYSNNSGFITFSQTGGTGSSDCSIVPLSINILSFQGKHLQGKNQLTWSSVHSEFVTHYEVQHSTDGSLWQKVEDISVTQGNDSYKVNHHNFKNEVNYYRLVEHYANGASSELNVITIDNREESKDLVRITNSMGQDVEATTPGLKIYIYADGTSVKRVN